MSGRSVRPMMAVLDRDDGFVWKLTEYMNEQSGFPFEAAAFTDPEKLAEYAARQDVRLLVMDEAFLENPRAKDTAAHMPLCLLLSSQPGTDGQGQSAPYQRLDRYRSADELINDILRICAEKAEEGPAMPGQPLPSGEKDGGMRGGLQGSAAVRTAENAGGHHTGGHYAGGRQYAVAAMVREKEAAYIRPEMNGGELIEALVRGTYSFSIEHKEIFSFIEQCSRCPTLSERVCEQECSCDVFDMIHL